MKKIALLSAVLLLLTGCPSDGEIEIMVFEKLTKCAEDKYVITINEFTIFKNLEFRVRIIEDDTPTVLITGKIDSKNTWLDAAINGTAIAMWSNDKEINDALSEAVIEMEITYQFSGPEVTRATISFPDADNDSVAELVQGLFGGSYDRKW